MPGDTLDGLPCQSHVVLGMRSENWAWPRGETVTKYAQEGWSEGGRGRPPSAQRWPFLFTQKKDNTPVRADALPP